MTRRRALLSATLLVASAVLGLIAANLLDFIRYRQAIARLQSLTPAEFRAIGDACATITEHPAAVPPALAKSLIPLQPLHVSVEKDCTDATLYRCGEAFIELSVLTTPANQRIEACARTDGPQFTTLCWERNPEKTKALAPTGRLLTITQWTMHQSREWIILPDHLMIVDRSVAIGIDDTLIADTPFSVTAAAAVKNAVSSIPTSIRGKAFVNPSVADGITLNLCFSPDGKNGPQDIRVANTWIDSLQPLLDVLAPFCPPDDRIHMGRGFEADPGPNPEPPTVGSIAWARTRGWPPPCRPWWCFWHRILQPSDPLRF